MKLLFVVQRYGFEVDGGAELYCRWVAEKFALAHDVSVLTTTARDYITWANEYPCGQITLNDVKVIRMAVQEMRDIEKFNRFTANLLAGALDETREEAWIRAQGPWSPGLLSYIENNHQQYDLLIFFTYLYAPSVFGIRIAPEKSILIPTAHDEPVAALNVFHRMYQQVAGLIYLTAPEKAFVESRYHVENTPNILLGTGIELPSPTCNSPDVMKKYGIRKPFVLYMGRIEAGKGCDSLIRFFQTFNREHDPEPMLVLAGRCHMKLPDDPSVRYIGFVPDGEIKPLIDASALVAVPSPFESLSILLLQAFACSRPVIANAASPVLLNHCRTSNAGLFYSDESEFIEALDLILHNTALSNKLGENGRLYIDAHFTWDVVIDRMESFLRHFRKSLD